MCDYREVGRSTGLLLAASDMVDDAVACVHYCEAQLNGNDAADSILLLGQSMGGGVAVELAALRFPRLTCVNQRSFSSLSMVSANMLGVAQSAAACGAVRLALVKYARSPTYIGSSPASLGLPPKTRPTCATLVRMGSTDCFRVSPVAESRFLSPSMAAAARDSEQLAAAGGRQEANHLPPG